MLLPVGGGKVKSHLVIGILALGVLSLVLVCLLWVSRIRSWPFVHGALKVSTLSIEDVDYLLVDGDPANYLGQIQVLSIEIEENMQSFLVRRHLIRWQPFSRHVVNSRWPLLYPLKGLPAGRYMVRYETDEGTSTAGTIVVEPSAIRVISPSQ